MGRNLLLCHYLLRPLDFLTTIYSLDQQIITENLLQEGLGRQPPQLGVKIKMKSFKREEVFSSLEG